MPPTFARLFTRRHSHQPCSRATTTLTSLESTREALLACVADCEGPGALRLRLFIASARTHRDLWMQRAKVYEVVSLAHGQITAHHRVEALQPLFAGGVDLHSANSRPSPSGWNSLTC